MEALYRKVKGVTEVVPGYMGGTVPNPSHEEVATGNTGHVEVVKLTYDLEAVTTEEILAIFFAAHDATAQTQVIRGPGSHYHSSIFYTDESDGVANNPDNGEQVGVIHRVIETLQATLPEGAPIITNVMSAVEFYPADELHYDYYEQHKDDSYTTTIIAPTLEAVQKQFPNNFL